MHGHSPFTTMKCISLSKMVDLSQPLVFSLCRETKLQLLVKTKGAKNYAITVEGYWSPKLIAALVDIYG